ncbi:PREDICTED: signal recognition particle 14 kDa protein [Nipponia nippon]|nr:PREDICTED: signal recognition particle 14 kDa protein [Nipponia nippon]
MPNATCVDLSYKHSLSMHETANVPGARGVQSSRSRVRTSGWTGPGRDLASRSFSVGEPGRSPLLGAYSRGAGRARPVGTAGAAPRAATRWAARGEGILACAVASSQGWGLFLLQFLTELTRLFQKCRTSGSVFITLKKYDGRTKPVPRKGHVESFEPADNKCLLRATDGKKKISTVVSSKEVNKFQMAYSNLLRANMDGLKKKDKKSKNKKSKATQ